MDACASTQPGKASGNAPYWSCVGEFCGHEGLGCLSPILKSQAIRSYSLHCRNVDLELYYSLWSMDSCKSFNYLLMVGFKGLAHVCLIAKLCQTLWDPMYYNLPGSSVCGISQARILEWVTVSSSGGSSWPMDRTHISCIGRQILYHWVTWKAPSTVFMSINTCTHTDTQRTYRCIHTVYVYISYICVLSHYSCVQLFATRWTVAHQAPLSVEFSRQKYWSGLPFLLQYHF